MADKVRYAVAGLALSAAGLAAITTYEGYRDTVYIPIPGDVPTAGYGHADIRLPVGKRIDKQQALKWLDEDTKEAENCIKSTLKVPVNQKIYDSLVSFVYNVGCNNYKKSTLLRKFNAGDLAGGCAEMTRWIYSKGKPVAGLKNRRENESKRCFEGLTDARMESDTGIQQLQSIK